MAQYLLILQSDGYFDKTKAIKKTENGKAALPILPTFLRVFNCYCSDAKTIDNDVNECPVHSNIGTKTWNYKEFTFTFTYTKFRKSGKNPILPRDRLSENILQLINELKVSEDMKESMKNALEQESPKSWERHGSLIMLTAGCFESDLWNVLGAELWCTVARSLKAEKVARMSVINRDGRRTPNVELLYGRDGWVEHRDNGVRYTYDVTKCMFSSGNITEKLRVAGWHCEGETVVDLYAGIGYFTLPYLVHTKASHVHACEWNPDAVIALRNNLKINHVADRCTIHAGDNRQVCPTGVTDRVNLGLIPSSEEGWRVACQALKPQTGGTLHIHANVTSQGTNAIAIDDACEIDNSSRRRRSSGESISRRTINTGDDIVCNDETQLAGKTETQVTCVDCQKQFEEVKDLTEKSEPDCSGDLLSSYRCTNCASKHPLNNPDCSSNCNNFNLKSDCSVEITQRRIVKEGSYDNVDVTSAKLKKPGKFAKKTKIKKEWRDWAETTSLTIREMLIDIHKADWTTEILHIEHVKSYAPHVDHLVLDLRCRPISV